MVAPGVDPAQQEDKVPSKGRPTMPVEDPFRRPPQMAVVTNGGQGAPREEPSRGGPKAPPQGDDVDGEHR